MKPPEQDLEQRCIVWDGMHVLFLDTDIDEYYFEYASKRCACTDYSLEELKQIYWLEVYAIMRWNLWDVAGEWSPIGIDSLKKAIMKRHKFGKRIWFKRYRSYAFGCWTKLEAEIVRLRDET